VIGDGFVPKPLQERAAVTIERVLAGTAELLDLAPEPEVTLTAISERSGVSTGSIYHHFGSRDQVILAAHARRFVRLMQRQRELLTPALTADAAPDLLAALERLLELIGQGVRDHDRVVGISVIAAARSRPELRQRISDDLKATTGHLAAHIAAAQSRGMIRPDLPPDALAVLMQVIVTMSRTAVPSDPGLDAEEWTAVVRALVHALVVHECPGSCVLSSQGADLPSADRRGGRAARPERLRVDVAVAPPDDEQILLQAVIAILDRDGPDGVVLRTVCEQVGVSPSWVHRRFGDRRQLIAAARLELARRHALREVDAFATLLDGARDEQSLARRLVEVVGEVGAAGSPEPHLERIDLVASAMHASGVRAAWMDVTGAVIDRMTMTLGALQERGLLRRDLPVRAVAQLLFGFMTAGVIARLAGIPPDAWTEVSAAVVDVLVRSVPGSSDA